MYTIAQQIRGRQMSTSAGIDTCTRAAHLDKRRPQIAAALSGAEP